jgi:hypothetical protein
MDARFEELPKQKSTQTLPVSNGKEDQHQIKPILKDSNVDCSGRRASESGVNRPLIVNLTVTLNKSLDGLVWGINSFYADAS